MRSSFVVVGPQIDLRFASPAEGNLEVVVAPVLRFADVGYNAGEAHRTELQLRQGTATIGLTPQSTPQAHLPPSDKKAVACHGDHLFLRIDHSAQAIYMRGCCYVFCCRCAH
jgi:hypothetical protein